MRTTTRHSGRIETNSARNYIAGLQQASRQLWAKMCEAEGVPVDSKFVIFSETNPYAVFYSSAVSQMQDAMRQYQAGGYIGLQIGA